MKQENKDKCFIAVTTILMTAVLIVVFLTIKEMPTTTTFAPIYDMGYPYSPR